MHLPIKMPDRPRHLVQQAIVKAFGGAEVLAGLCLLQPITVRKWCEDPDRGSGQDITVKNLQKLLTHAGQQLSNLPLQNLIDEFLQQHFLALCHRRVYPEERIFEMMELLQNGHRR